MAKIRDDFEGVVYAEGLVLKAGDKIPAGVRVGGHLTDSGKDVGPAPDEKPTPAVAPVDVQDPLNDDDAALAAELGVEGSPEFVRVFLDGVAFVSGEPEGDPEGATGDESDGLFDPSEVNAPEVHEYLAAHPDDVERVIALEREGKARAGILNAYEGPR